MKSPRTRLDEATTELERDLLRSWSAERPSAHARHKALGIAVVATGTAAGSAAGATGGAAIGAAAGAKATGTLALLVGKWLIVGGAVAAGALVARPYLRRPEPLPATRPAEVSAPPAPPVRAPTVAPAPAAAGVVPAPPPAPEVRPAPSAPARRAFRSRLVDVERPAVEVVAAPPEPKRATRELGEQVASLDRAERALAAGDAAEALRLADDYDRRFPTGSLLQEATVVRVEALLKLGHRDEAARVGRTFLASHPSSPYAAKIRRRLDGGSIP
jgi:hypothetical protein